MAPEWMNWPGWRWIAPFIGMAVGIYIGWDARGFRARLDKQLSDLKAGRCVALVEHLAMCTDPHKSPSQEDEVEAFAHHIRVAKGIVGDLTEDVGGHP